MRWFFSRFEYRIDEREAYLPAAGQHHDETKAFFQIALDMEFAELAGCGFSQDPAAHQQVTGIAGKRSSGFAELSTWPIKTTFSESI